MHQTTIDKFLRELREETLEQIKKILLEQDRKFLEFYFNQYVKEVD